MNITWVTEGIVTYIALFYCQGDKMIAYILASTGSFSWTISNDFVPANNTCLYVNANAEYRNPRMEVRVSVLPDPNPPTVRLSLCCEAFHLFVCLFPLSASLFAVVPCIRWTSGLATCNHAMHEETIIKKMPRCQAHTLACAEQNHVLRS